MQLPLDGLKLAIDETVLKGRTKDLIGYLHEKLKRVSIAHALCCIFSVLILYCLIHCCYLHVKLNVFLCQSVEYYHMKLMIVGYGGRGKSTLLRALMKKRQPEKSLPTVGVVVQDWKYVLILFSRVVTHGPLHDLGLTYTDRDTHPYTPIRHTHTESSQIVLSRNQKINVCKTFHIRCVIP